MTREEIDAFLVNEKDMDQVIRNIAKKATNPSELYVIK